MKPQARTVLGVRIPTELKRELKRLALAEKRSLSNLAEVLLTEALKQKEAA